MIYTCLCLGQLRTTILGHMQLKIFPKSTDAFSFYLFLFFRIVTFKKTKIRLQKRESGEKNEITLFAGPYL